MVCYALAMAEAATAAGTEVLPEAPRRTEAGTRLFSVTTNHQSLRTDHSGVRELDEGVA